MAIAFENLTPTMCSSSKLPSSSNDTVNLKNSQGKIYTRANNKTLHQLICDLYKANKITNAHFTGDQFLAEKIKLIRSNLEFIVKKQEEKPLIIKEYPTVQNVSQTLKQPRNVLNGCYDTNEDRERSIFIKDLLEFMEIQGQPILKPPKLGFQDLDLYKLYKAVIKRGGMDIVTRRQAWKEVYLELGIPTISTSASYNTRTNYKK